MRPPVRTQTNGWVAWAARGHAYTDLATVPARSVAIVPGAPVAQGRPLFTLTARLEAALTLFRAGRVKQVLVSGNDTRQSPETTVMQSWLRDRGVPAGSIIADHDGSRTRETMNRAAGLYDVSDAIVCTQDVNMQRSLFLAQKAGIDSVGFMLPSRFTHSVRYHAREALKSTLAAIEALLRPGPEALAAERSTRALVAAR